MDVSSASLVRSFGQDAFRELVASLAPEVVFANRDEAPLVAGVAVPLLVVKRGGEPIELVVGGSSASWSQSTRCRGVADTTGAGDAFAGGFLAATIAGADQKGCRGGRARGGQRRAAQITPRNDGRARPVLCPMELDAALDFVRSRHQGVLVTLKRDGRPQLSNIAYYVGDDGVVRISITERAGEDGQHPP